MLSFKFGVFYFAKNLLVFLESLSQPGPNRLLFIFIEFIKNKSVLMKIFI